MASRRDLAILSQVRQGEKENKCVLENGTGCADTAIAQDAGWTLITESVVAEDHLISDASDVNISKEHHPGRSPLL
jgi:hypothetical protein